MPQRREFLQQAVKFNPIINKIGGWYLSGKLDGIRCLWDGGISRGVATEVVPWANILDPRTGQLKDRIKPVSTGLWTRYGNPIMAPDWFLDMLPKMPLDGKLWAGYGNYDLCKNVCAAESPHERFKELEYAVFSSPPLDALFRTGLIKDSNTNMMIDYQRVARWIKRQPPIKGSMPSGSALCQELFVLRAVPDWNDKVYLLKHIILPTKEHIAQAAFTHYIQKFRHGVVLSNPNNTWTPKRTCECVKFALE